MRETWRDVFWTGAAKAYSLLVSVGIVALTARALGPAGRGELAVIITWVSAFATLGHLSLGQVALHRAAQSKDMGWLGQALPVLTAWMAMASIVGWVFVAGLYFLTKGSLLSNVQPSLLAIGFLLLPLLIWEQYGTHVLMAMSRLATANRAQVVGKSVSLGAVALALGVWGPSLPAVLACTIAGQVVTSVGGSKAMREQWNGMRVQRAALADYLRSGLQLHLNAVGTFLFTSADLLILNHYAGPAQAGLYQIGVQMLTVMMVLPQAACSVLYAKVAKLGPDGAWPEQRRMLLLLAAGMLVLVAVMAALAHWIVLLLAGASFLPAVPLFRLQLLTALGMTVAAVMAPQWIGRGFFRLASAITLLVGTLNISLSLWLVPSMGMWGAAWANVATYLFAILGNGSFALWCELRARKTGAAHE
jgi:O-antigen/teichoic acid export membrane protein